MTYKNTGLKLETNNRIQNSIVNSDVGEFTPTVSYQDILDNTEENKVEPAPALVILDPPIERFLWNSTNVQNSSWSTPGTTTTANRREQTGGWHTNPDGSSGMGRNVTTTTTVGGVVNTTTTTTTTNATSLTTSTLIPFMRAKRIYFTASGLKPNAKILAFFDNTDVTEYCTQLNTTSLNSDLIVSANGKLNGYFDLPSGRFKTGTRDFVLTDVSPLDNSIAPTTKAKTQYTANGVRVDTLITERINTSTNTQVTRGQDTTTTTAGRWDDPVAQSFVVETADSDKGVFIKAIDLYFSNVDPRDEVLIQIRGCTNGYPNDSILYPYSWAKRSASEIVVSDNGSIPTKFEFETPIYLPSNDEYCFVVMCNTDKTEIWISEMGKKAFKPTDTIQPTGEFISKQPYLGSMFISQNSTTWSAEQLKDIKFKIYKCKFKNSGRAVFVNNNSDVYAAPNVKLMIENCLTFVKSSKTVKLKAEGHGWIPGDKFILNFGADVEENIFGIPKINLENKLLTVKNATPTYITFDVATAATGSGTAGGEYCSVIGWNIAFSYAQLLSKDIVLDKTKVDYIFNGRVQSNYTSIPSGSHDMSSDDIVDLNQTYVTKKDADGGLMLICPIETTDANISPILNSNAIGFETHLNVISNIDYLDSNNNIQEDASPARYIQKEVNLINPANELKIFFESNIPAECNISVYYKTGTAKISDDEKWKKLEPDEGKLLMSDNPDEFRTQKYTKNFGSQYEFDIFKVMIVLMSQTKTKVPKIKNYRAIALNA